MPPIPSFPTKNRPSLFHPIPTRLRDRETPRSLETVGEFRSSGRWSRLGKAPVSKLRSMSSVDACGADVPGRSLSLSVPGRWVGVRSCSQRRGGARTWQSDHDKKKREPLRGGKTLSGRCGGVGEVQDLEGFSTPTKLYFSRGQNSVLTTCLLANTWLNEHNST